MVEKNKKKNTSFITFYVKTTTHNMFISLLKKNNKNYKLLKLMSCGLLGFKNKSKITSFACNLLAYRSVIYLIERDFKYIHVVFKGLNLFKKIILNTIVNTSINNKSLKILSISDLTSYPHNGCKKKKIKKR